MHDMHMRPDDPRQQQGPLDRFELRERRARLQPGAPIGSTGGA
jgi:hypothetical protein